MISAAFNVIVFEGFDLAVRTSGSGHERNRGYGHGGIADDANGAVSGSRLQGGGDLGDGGGGQSEEVRIRAVLIRPPSELIDHAG